MISDEFTPMERAEMAIREALRRNGFEKIAPHRYVVGTGEDCRTLAEICVTAYREAIKPKKT